MKTFVYLRRLFNCFCNSGTENHRERHGKPVLNILQLVINIIYINMKLDSCLNRKDRCSFICHSCSEGALLARMQESPDQKVNFFYSLMLRIVSHRGTKRSEIFLLLLISPRIHTDDHRLMKQVFIIH